MASLKLDYPFHLAPGGPALLRGALREAFKHLPPLDESDRMLLIGSKFGENLLAMTDSFPGKLIGVDEDPESVFFSKMTAQRLGLTQRCSFRVMSPLTLDILPGSARVVVLEGIFSSYPPGKVLKQALNALAPDGVFIFSDSFWQEGDIPRFVREVWESPDHKLYRREELEQQLVSHGLRPVLFTDASKRLEPFYAQFSGTVKDITRSEFEGLKHMKSLVKHYKHEIDVYLKNGGDRWMGYCTAVCTREPAEEG